MTFELAPPDNPDIELDALAATTYSAVFSDICDGLGLRNQTVSPGVVPLGQGGTLIGWARTALSEPVEAAPARPYGNEIAYIDSLRTGDVAVVNCSGAPAAAWGELFSTASKGRGARGVVVDGLIRDRRKIVELGFPVYARGHRPTDSLGRVSIVSADTEMLFGGVAVRSGDLVVADEDGVVIVPRDYVDRAVTRAIEKASTEDKARSLLLAGGKLADVWERFRVL